MQTCVGGRTAWVSRPIAPPNGVCLTGDWMITEPTEYTGYFRQDSRGLVIGRYSVG